MGILHSLEPSKHSYIRTKKENTDKQQELAISYIHKPEQNQKELRPKNF